MKEGLWVSQLVRHGVCVGAEQGGWRGEVEVCGEVVGGQIA